MYSVPFTLIISYIIVTSCRELVYHLLFAFFLLSCTAPTVADPTSCPLEWNMKVVPVMLFKVYMHVLLPCVWAWIGPMQATNTSHSHISLHITDSLKNIQQGGVYSCTHNTCSPSCTCTTCILDIRLHNTKLHNTI